MWAHMTHVPWATRGPSRLGGHPRGQRRKAPRDRTPSLCLSLLSSQIGGRNGTVSRDIWGGHRWPLRVSVSSRGQVQTSPAPSQGP